MGLHAWVTRTHWKNDGLAQEVEMGVDMDYGLWVMGCLDVTDCPLFFGLRSAARSRSPFDVPGAGLEHMDAFGPGAGEGERGGVCCACVWIWLIACAGEGRGEEDI